MTGGWARVPRAGVWGGRSRWERVCGGRARAAAVGRGWLSLPVAPGRADRVATGAPEWLLVDGFAAHADAVATEVGRRSGRAGPGFAVPSCGVTLPPCAGRVLPSLSGACGVTRSVLRTRSPGLSRLPTFFPEMAVARGGCDAGVLSGQADAVGVPSDRRGGRCKPGDTRADGERRGLLAPMGRERTHSVESGGCSL